MSFWKAFGFQTISPVDAILDKDGFTLEDLLEEEELLQEVKSQNKKLLEFLIEPQQLRKLFDYVTKEPDTGDDTKRRYKYPYLATEILCSEVWPICDAVYKHEQLLDSLYSFLEKDPPLNPRLIAYVSKVAGSLLQKKVNETIDYLQRKDHIVQHFLKHIGSSSVMEWLLKVIAAEDPSEGTGVIDWLSKSNLVESLVAMLKPENESDIHENASQTLVNVINLSPNWGTPSPLIAQLENKASQEQLNQYILSAQSDGSTLLHGLPVLCELLRRNARASLDDLTTLEELPPLLQVILDNLSKYAELLKQPASPPETVPSELAPQFFGVARLKVVEFLLALVKTNYRCVSHVLMSMDIFNALLELFFVYQWNNFLHTYVEGMLHFIFQGGDTKLKTDLFDRCHLHKRVIKAERENAEQLASNNIGKGYLGHLTLIVNYIITAAPTTPELAKLLDEDQEWVDFVNGSHAERCAVESKDLGGPRPSAFPSQSSEDEDDGHDFETNPGISSFSGGFVASFDNDDDDDEDDEDEDFAAKFDPSQDFVTGDFDASERNFSGLVYDDEDEGSSSGGSSSEEEDGEEEEEEEEEEGGEDAEEQSKLSLEDKMAAIDLEGDANHVAT